jgi:BNR repeat-containing family member
MTHGVRGDSSLLFSPDGAWCWFQDPRGVYVEGERRRTYAGWISRRGRLEVGAYDCETGQVETTALEETWQADDHNSNSFLVLPDRRLMAFYSRHDGRGLYGRLAAAPEDIGRWSERMTISDEPGTTYSQPVHLEEEGRYFLFWRGPSWKPTVSISSDLRSWSAAQALLRTRGRSAADIRPYLKVISDGRAAIHFAFTDGHPRDEPANSIYYLRYRKGVFRAADGTELGAIDRLPIEVDRRALVYDAGGTGARAWIWDVAADAAGQPLIAYTRLPGEGDHRYHYALWSGGEWIDHEITCAGGAFPRTPLFRRQPEPHYSGGIAFKHAEPSIVYLSKKIDGVFEIERWQTADGGRTWDQAAITRGSRESNVRPVVPRGYSRRQDHLLWMRGPYRQYNDYHTAIRMAISPPPAVRPVCPAQCRGVESDGHGPEAPLPTNSLTAIAKAALPLPLRRVLRPAHRRFVFWRAIRALRRDPESALAPGSRVLRDLIYGWNNAWSAGEEYLEACVRDALACRGPILECGSGLTTIVLGAIAQRSAGRVWSLEHSQEWGDRVARYLATYRIGTVSLAIRPLKDYGGFSWYQPPLRDLPRAFHLVVCDGPPGTTEGGRYGLAPIMKERLAPGCVILLDDAGRQEEQSIARRWAAELRANSLTLGSKKPYVRLVLEAGGEGMPENRNGENPG